ncbi:unnamed protein product, partial [Polarella glacialis]
VSTEASADTSPVKTCLLEEKLLAHHLGKCKPCCYHYFKVDGCRKGDDCEFCHFCSLEDVKERKRSDKRQARNLKWADKKCWLHGSLPVQVRQFEVLTAQHSNVALPRGCP